MTNEAFARGLPIGVAVGISIGVALGVSTDNMGLIGAGLAIGIGLSPLFGQAMKSKDSDASDVDSESDD